MGKRLYKKSLFFYDGFEYYTQKERYFNCMLFSSIKEDEFELCHEFVHKDVVYKEVRIKNRGCRCECGAYHTNVKEYRTKRITHSIYAHQKCIVIYHQRRFICPKCGATHMEENPFTSDNNHVSDKTVMNILNDLKRYNTTFREAAENNDVSVMEAMHIFDRYCQMERLRMPEVLCIDEIYFSRTRRKKYVLVLLNFHNRSIIDVLKDRDKHTLSSYLGRLSKEEKARIQYVSIDMTENYRDVLQHYLRNAIIVADSFHVMKHLADALDSIRLRVMKRFEDDKKSDPYYLLKYRNELLYSTEVDYRFRMNKHFHRYISQNQMLDMMLALDPDLKKAHQLYHTYKYFNDSSYTDLPAAYNRLSEIINEFLISGIHEFESLASTLSNWKAEIVNSFCVHNGKRISNGPIEGRNSLIKKILRLANGYSNFHRFRNRIMYSLNKLSRHSFRPE